MRRYFSLLVSLWLALSPGLSALNAAEQAVSNSTDLSGLSLLEKERQMRDELEKKIQSDILDPILGKGKAMVFVTLQLEIVAAREKMVQKGSGTQNKSDGAANKLFADTEYLLPGIPKPKKLGDEDKEGQPTQARSQEAKQEQGQERERITQKTVVKNLEIVILHDQRSPKNLTDMARDRIVDALRQFKIQPNQVILKPIQMQEKILDDIKQPSVYIPTLFALLVFLLLMFLFGPVASTMRGYLRMMEKREGNELSIDSETEMRNPDGEKPGQAGAGGGGGGGGMGLGTSLEGEIEGEGGKKSKEDLELEKVFTYITEENVGRLIYLLKREEAWVTAVVLNYLNPKYGQKVLNSIPVERQAQIAIEMATIRQLTREQVQAIDKDIHERVNFVIGGIGPLIDMLNDSDAQTMESILEYLKNEKPEIYEKVRKRLVLFDDLVSMPDRVVATLFRELKPVEIARALKGTPPELEQKVFTNMSSGAANLVKEEMELLGEISAEDVLKERAKIITAIKRLEAEGKISFREKHQETVLEGVEEDAAKAAKRKKMFQQKVASAEAAEAAAAEPAPQAAVTEAAGVDFYSQGVEFYNAGRYAEAAEALVNSLQSAPESWEAYQYLGGSYYALGQFQEAIQCYERVLELNPSEEMQAFVAQMKTEAGVSNG